MSEPASAPLLVDLPAQLVGPRVRVRPYEEADWPALWEAIEESRTHLAPWMGWIRRYTAPDHALVHLRRSRARWLAREELTVGIFEAAAGLLLGEAGLTGIDWQVRRFEIGYWVRPSAEGRGYVSETVQLLTRGRSRAVPERLGFVLEGCLRRWSLDPTGQLQDLLVWSLVSEEYATLEWARGAEP